MKITNWLYTHSRIFTLIVFFAVLSLFVTTIPSFNVGYADSDEFLAVAKEWGIAHPPGYSLYVGALHLITKISIPFTTYAFRAHLVSALASALTIALVIPISKLIYLQLPRKLQLPHLFVASSIISTLFLATNQQVWLYSQITEKYIFAAPFILSLILLGLLLLQAPRPPALQAVLFGLLFGLGLGHHQSLIFLLPFWLIIFAKTIKKNLAIHQIFGLIGGLLISISLLFIQVNRQTELSLSWYSGDGLTGVINHLTRKDFKGEIYYTGTVSNGYIPANLNPQQILISLVNYLRLIGQSFGWFIYLPLSLGIYLLFKKYKSLFWLVLPFLLLGPILAGYLGWPKDVGTQAITSRFYLLSYYSLAPIIFTGTYIILSRIQRASQILSAKTIVPYLLILLFPLLQILNLVSLYPQVSLKNFDFVSKLYQTTLNQLKPNSLLTCYSDTSCFALLYEQAINQLRPDIQVIPLTYPLIHNQLQSTPLTRFNYTSNPFLLMDIVTNNLNHRPVYAVDLDQYYFNFFGLKNPFMFYLPTEYAGQLSQTMPAELDSASYQLSAAYSDVKVPTFDLYRQHLIKTFAQTHVTNAFTILKRGDRNQAQILLNFAGNLSANLLPPLTAEIQAGRLQVEQTLPDEKFTPGTPLVSVQKLIEAIPEYQKAGQNGTAFSLALGAITIDPNSVEARLALAKMYLKAKDFNFAKIEYRNILVIDPQNSEAIQALESL